MPGLAPQRPEVQIPLAPGGASPPVAGIAIDGMREAIRSGGLAGRSLGRRRFWRAAAGAALAGFVPPAAEAARFSIVILDPGHGGSDKGANWGGVHEKTLTLDVARRAHRLFGEKGLPAVLTRTSDTFVSKDDRAAKANRYRSAVFVSIHFNAHPNRSIRGIETFYMSTAGRSLATRVHSRLAKRIRTRDRGLKHVSNFAVLRKTNCPAILVECGFISNAWERARCATSGYRQTVAQAIVEGVLSYR